MDFLDPRKRRAHKIRLFIGYFLMAIVIGLATVILVYAAYGYGINTKTGQIIENGLLFTDSKPGGADIYLNGQKQSSQTAARLVLNAGVYSLKIQKDGYRPWQRSFILNEHTVARYVYPFLFPQKPFTLNLKTYAAAPQMITQTPDRHWLLVSTPQSTQGNLVFDEYDTSNLAKTPLALELPKTVITAADNGSYKLVEWATNNNQLLLEHSYPGGDEFVVFDRAKPENSFNVNKLFGLDPLQVRLKDKKADQFYILNKNNALQVGDVGQQTVTQPIIKNVLAFHPYGNNIVTFVTAQGAPTGKVKAMIWDTARTYQLYTLAAGSNYLLNVAQFQSHWYYVAGSDSSTNIDVFKDPEDQIRNPVYGKAVPFVGLPENHATTLEFSENTRFIAAQSGQEFSVYDLEQGDSYRYSVKQTLSGPMDWMDGHRFIGVSGGKIIIFDYDYKNQVDMGETVLASGAFFSRDYNQMINVLSDGSGGFNLTRIDLRAGSDLPADHSQ